LIKSRKTVLRLSQEDSNRLRETQIECARCWNTVVELARTFWIENRDWASKSWLQKQVKKQFRLHSQTIQAIVDRFCANRLTCAQNRRMGLKTRYPWRVKKYVSIPFKQKAIKQSRKHNLVLTLFARSRIVLPVIPDIEIRTCEIAWKKDRYVLICTHSVDCEESAPGIRAGVDIGEIHPAAVVTELGDGLIVSGREVRSRKQGRNQALAWFSKALSRCKKGSRRYKRLLKAKARLRNKVDDQVRDLLHQGTRKVINWCKTHQVSKLVIGNPAGVEKNTKKKRRLNRVARQKVSQMETGRIKQYLTYKAAEAGIATVFVNERGTSSNCPVCGNTHKPKGREFRCTSCGYVAHRDAKAGFMMLWKNDESIELPPVFRLDHSQCIPKYRKAVSLNLRSDRACVDGPDVALSSLARIEPLRVECINA